MALPIKNKHPPPPNRSMREFFTVIFEMIFWYVFTLIFDYLQFFFIIQLILTIYKYTMPKACCRTFRKMHIYCYIFSMWKDKAKLTSEIIYTELAKLNFLYSKGPGDHFISLREKYSDNRHFGECARNFRKKSLKNLL